MNDRYEGEHLLQAYAGIEGRNFWFQARAGIICDAFASYFPGAKNLIDIGCGTGFLLEEIGRHFPRVRLHGVEPSRAGFDFACCRLPHADIHRSNIETYKAHGKFDVVCAFDVLEHVEDDVNMLKKLSAMCRPGGGLMLTVPQHPFLWSKPDEYAGHWRRYRRSELAHKCADAGFKAVFCTSFVSLLFPALYLSRIAQRCLPVRSAQIDAGFELPGLVNRVLSEVMSVERRLISRRTSLPFGGSLLLVAEKRMMV